MAADIGGHMCVWPAMLGSETCARAKRRRARGQVGVSLSKRTRTSLPPDDVASEISRRRRPLRNMDSTHPSRHRCSPHSQDVAPARGAARSASESPGGSSAAGGGGHAPPPSGVWRPRPPPSRPHRVHGGRQRAVRRRVAGSELVTITAGGAAPAPPMWSLSSVVMSGPFVVCDGRGGSLEQEALKGLFGRRCQADPQS